MAGPGTWRRHRRDPRLRIARAKFGEICGRPLETIAFGFVEFDYIGDQQRLTANGTTLARGPHPFEHQTLVSCMLVDDHQPVFGLGDDVSRGDLAARHTKRVARHWRHRRLGACDWRLITQANLVGDLARHTPERGSTAC